MFIAFEGIEGSGKSTLVEGVAKGLRKRGRNVLTTREPGASPLGKKLRALLLDLRTENLTKEAEIFLFLADRAQHVNAVIRPALQAGKIVLCDRYQDSTIAYQGYGRGLDMDELISACKLASGGLEPDIVFLLDLPVEEGLRRAAMRNLEKGIAFSEGRFDGESMAFHKRVAEGYSALAEKNAARTIILNGLADKEELVNQCLDFLHLPPIN